MCRTGRFLVYFLTTVACGQALAQPLVLLTDTFERTTGVSAPGGDPFLSDWGSNDNGLGGSLVQTYLTTPTRTTGGGVNQTVQEADDPANGENEGVIRFGAISIDYDFASDPNVLAGGGYTVEFDGRRGVSGANFLSFHLGTNPQLIATTSNQAAFLPITSMDAGEHAYLYQRGDFEDLRMQVFEFGAQLDPPGNIDFVTADALAEFRTKITVLAPDGFDIGDEITISVEVDDTEVTGATHTVAIAGEYPGYIGWSSNSGAAIIDNLVITALGTATGLPGDFNDDNRVNLADYTVWRDNLGGSFNLAGNGDESGSSAGTVDQADYLLWKDRFGDAAAASALQAPGLAAVPEPATWVATLMLGLGGLGSWRSKKR